MAQTNCEKCDEFYDSFEYDDCPMCNRRERDLRNTMDRDYPRYSQGSKNAGRFLGLDHPYVPGDPGL